MEYMWLPTVLIDFSTNMLDIKFPIEIDDFFCLPVLYV